MNQMTFDFSSPVRVRTIGELISLIESAHLSSTRSRDQISGLRRLCKIANRDPAFVDVSPPTIRNLLETTQPAAHGITAKTWTNIRTNVNAALKLADLVDDVRGRAGKCHVWDELAHLAKQDKSLETGLATFMGFCSLRSIHPAEVSDEVVLQYLVWLENRTILHDPEDRARQVPRLWNRLRQFHPAFVLTELEKLSFRKPTKTAWEAMDAGFRADAEAYLQMRADPDLDDDDAPDRPLAASTLRQLRETVRLAYDVVARGRPERAPRALADLVQLDALKMIIAAYRKDDGSSSSFLTNLIQYLLQIAQYHVRVSDSELTELKKKTRRYRSLSNGLTEKNKATLRQFDDDRVRANLFRLPDELMRKGRKMMGPEMKSRDLAKAARLFQEGLGIAILLNAPMRPQNLVALDTGRHVRFGRHKAPARILIPASETKSKRIDLSYELSGQFTEALQWYQKNLLPVLGGDTCGRLFVLPGGAARSQSNLSNLIKKALAKQLGIQMTPHQFRHLAAKFYLDEHPQDFETVRQVLGHSFSKTTHIYAGLGNERGSRVYSGFITDQAQKPLRGRGRDQSKKGKR